MGCHTCWKLIMQAQALHVTDVQALTATTVTLRNLTRPYLQAMCLANVLMLRKMRRARRRHPWPHDLEFCAYYKNGTSFTSARRRASTPKSMAAAIRLTMQRWFPVAHALVDGPVTIKQINAALQSTQT